ncbi:MAG: SEL1-like repeat protein [Synergistaceae bacterium]|nr:SEL1-like repeat protein [Synergistaceae bacterium]
MRLKLKLIALMLLSLAVEAQAAQVVNINNIADDFINNPIKASQVWNGQEIYAGGEVTEIRQESLTGEFVIRIKGGRANYFDCYLDKSSLSAAANLSKGGNINIKGVVSGFSQSRDSIIVSFNIVRINNSVIIDSMPSPEDIKQASETPKSKNYNDRFNALFASYSDKDTESINKNFNLNNKASSSPSKTLSPEESFKLYQEAAEQGSFIAQNNLGVYYRDGIIVEKNLDEAFKYFKLSAEKNYAPAQYNLGLLYYYNNKNLSEAAKYFNLAANNGDARALVYLGFMAYSMKNYPTAAFLYRQAAEANNPEGMNNLASLYRSGQGVPKNLSEAFALYSKAAELGLSAAMFNLGEAYNNGFGTVKDKAKALDWYKKAAAQGYKPAEDAIKKLTQPQAPANNNQDKKQQKTRPFRATRIVRKGVVSGDIVNIRSEPNMSSNNVIRKLKLKTSVKVLKQQGSWYLIRTQKGIEGWMSADYINLI